MLIPHYRRRAARVLLVDAHDRLLLLSSRSDHGELWVTPGGGRRRFERLSRAAARELHEEVGLAVDHRALGRPVAYTAGHADLGWASGTFREDYFFHRVATHEVDTSRMEELEAGLHTGHRWWPIPDLASTTQTIYPYGLAPLLTDLLAGHRPPRPVRLPWHH